MSLKTRTLAGIDTTLTMFQNDIAEAVIVAMVAAHIKGDLKAQKALGMEISLDLVNKAAQDYAKVHGVLLRSEGATIIKGKKIPWLADSNKDLRAQVVDIIQKGLDEGKPVAEIGGKRVAPGTIAKDLQDALVRDRGYKNVRIARSEVARVQNIGSLTRYQNRGITRVRVLDDEGPNSCEECKMVNGQIWTLEKAMVNELEHPNCVRSFAPIVE